MISNLSLHRILSRLCIIVALATCFSVSPAWSTPVQAAAGINKQISYQAKLFDPSGSPVADGSYQVKISLYDAASAGTRLWTATGTTAVPTALSVNVVNGLFTLNLGDTSAAGGFQNAFDGTMNWNDDSIYLGITIAADAEMSPRKRLSTTPYAFNAERLQGMYASSSAFGASNVFALNQTSNTAATGTRSTLEVRSSGTSNANDFLIRGVNDLNTPVFTINRQGNVTTTGNLVAAGDITGVNASFTALLVGGQSPCLANGTNCLPTAPSSSTLQDVTNQGNTTTNAIQFNGGTSTGLFTTGQLSVTSSAALAAFTATNGTTTNASSTNLFSTSASFTNATSTGWFGFATASGTTLTALNLNSNNVAITGGVINGTAIGNIAPSTGVFTNVTSTNGVFTNVTSTGVLRYATVTGTNIYGQNATFTNLSLTNFNPTNLTWTNATGTNTTSTNLFATNLNATNVTATSLAAVNASTTYANIFNLQNVSIDTAGINVGGNINTTDITVTGTASVINFDATNATTTNATTTKLFTTNIIGTNATFTNLGLSNVTTTNFFSTTVSSTNLTALNLNANNVTILGGTATFSTVTSTNVYAVNTTGTYQSLTDFTNTNASSIYSIPDAGSVVARSIAIDKNRIFVAKESSGIFFFDNNNPEAPVFLGSQGYTLTIKDMVVAGNYLYVASLEGVGILDLNTQGVIPSTFSTGAGSDNYGIFVRGDYAYVAASTTGMKIVDISNKRAPRLISTTSVIGAASKITVSGNYAYVSVFDTPGNNGIQIFDIRNPYAPFSTTSNQAWDAANDIAVHEHFILLAAGTDGLIVLNTVDPSSANFIAQVNTPGSAVGVTVSGRYAYVSDATGGLAIIDISLLGTVAPVLPTIATVAATSNVRDAAVSGQHIYYLDEALKSYKLPSARMTAADIASLQASNVLITRDLNVGGGLSLQGGLNAGAQSAFNAGLSISASSTSFAAAHIRNTAPTSSGSAWGAYINTLLVGATSTATGTADYVSAYTYNGTLQNGICLDDLSTSETCLSNPGTSITADGSINASAFDLAEWYRASGPVTSTDLVIIDNASSTMTKVSDGTPYDPRLMGIASTKPGLLLGHNLDVKVALSGRVPTKVSTINGSIQPGDALTSSQFPGVAMKATKPGMIVGYALETASATSTIEVFVKVGYSAGSLLSNNGSESLLTDNLVVAPQSTATVADQSVDSWGLTFRGSAWDAASSTAVSSQFTIATNVINATSSTFNLQNTLGQSILSVSQTGDLSLAGRFYPATRSGKQDQWYLFVDDSSAPTSSYMATNADGWQTNDTYDFAERYYSPEPLEAGEVVTLSQTGRFHVQRAASSTEMTMGIVSTRPGFVTGRPASSTYPIALAGRVPTKVSAMNGAINIGDPIGPSTIPGVAVKLTKNGPMVGYAMEAFQEGNVGTVEVFVSGGWYGKFKEEPIVIENTTSTTITNNIIQTTSSTQPTTRKGFASIAASAKKVTVNFPSINAYPNIQVQPRGQVIGGFYTDEYTDKSFTIIVNEAQSRDVVFSWFVTATDETDQVYLSDGTFTKVNAMTGETVQENVESVPVEGVDDVETIEQSVEEVSVTSTVYVPEVEETSSTEEVIEQP